MGGFSGIGLSWLVLAFVYLAFVGGFGFAEGAAAILCGGLGAVWVRQIARCGDAHLGLNRPAFAPLAASLVAAFAKLPGETARVGLSLLRVIATGETTGHDRTIQARAAGGSPLGGDGPDAAGARAVAVLAASLSPDAYVLRREPERGRVLLHALLPETRA